MYVLIAYDIADPRRLYRVAKIMEDYGHRVQYSIFEAELERAQLQVLQARAGEVINEEADGVKYFPLCERCLQRVTVHGKGQLPELSGPYVIL